MLFLQRYVEKGIRPAHSPQKKKKKKKKKKKISKPRLFFNVFINQTKP